MSDEIVDLKPSAVGSHEMESVGRSGIILGAVCLLTVLSGVPAAFVTFMWGFLQIGTILNFPNITDAEVFRHCYLIGFAAVIAPVMTLAAMWLLSRRSELMLAHCRLTEDGFQWVGRNVVTKLLLRTFGLPTKSVPWNELVAVTFNDAYTFDKVYGVSFFSEGNVATYASTTSAFISFWGRKKQGGARRLNRLYAHGLSQEAKKTLLESLHKWAPQAILTKNVTEELLGIEVQERDLQFTQIWLELMKSDRTRRRTGNLSAEEVLNDGNYRVTGKLATGGQANLYLATNFDDEIVVLKEFILANNVADSAVSSLGEFEREFTILQRAANPSVPKLLDSFVEDSRAYLVLEFIDGPSLRSVVQARGRLPWTEVVPLAVQVCKALQFLHTLDQPVIHRDISPDNILLLGDQPKIIDFSVAALGECEKPGEVVGKPAYVSVKQFQGIIQRSNDIYSLGATLFYLLTGSDPEPVSQSSPSDGAPDIPAELDELVKRCTSVDSKSQIDSVEEVLLTLEALAESLLPVVEPANSG